MSARCRTHHAAFPAFVSSSTSRTRERLQAALSDRFTIERELGGGGMSETFVAHDATLGRSIVIKVLAPALADGVNLERFSREIAIGATLQHPNLVPVLDTGVADGLPYFTMPFVAGDSLRRRLNGTGMPVPDALSILRDVARGLGAAHARGVVHRDVKPDNVLLSGDAAVVTDLGIAKALASAGDASSLTRTGFVMGTPAYFAPEQASGDPIDARADWYAYGVMAFEMLTGRLPFTAPTDAGLLVAHVTVPAPDLRTFRHDLPEPLCALVMRCLAKEPAERPATSDDVVRALDSALADTAALRRAVRMDVGDAAKTTGSTTATLGGRASRGMRTRLAAAVAVAAVAAVIWWRRDAADAPVAVAAAGAGGPQMLWIATLPPGDSAGVQRLRVLARVLRERIPGAAGVELSPVDTVLADTAAAAQLARAQRAAVLLLGERRSTRGGDTTRTWGALFTDRGVGGCRLEQPVATRDTSPPVDLVQRVLGVLAMRYDALLEQRYMRGARLAGREGTCAGYRLDALQLLAAARADSLRPQAERMADLQAALRLDSGFIEARMDLAMATGDTTTSALLRAQMSADATGRLEMEVMERLARAPLEALDLAERGRETGQVSAGTLAHVYLITGRARTALGVLDALDASDIEVAGGAPIVAAMRASALFQLGDDRGVLRVLGKPAPADADLYARLRLPSLAALGDSAGWFAAWRQTREPPEGRLRTLLRSAGAATIAGRAGLARALYGRARDEGEVLLQGTRPSPYVVLSVAEARRRVGDHDGAEQLLQRLRNDRDSTVMQQAEARLALLALERGDERLARETITLLERRDARAPGWRSALALARLESVRGRLEVAATQLRRAIALGAPREHTSPVDDIGEFRTDADLVALFSTAAGRALMLAND